MDGQSNYTLKQKCSGCNFLLFFINLSKISECFAEAEIFAYMHSTQSELVSNCPLNLRRSIFQVFASKCAERLLTSLPLHELRRLLTKSLLNASIKNEGRNQFVSTQPTPENVCLSAGSFHTHVFNSARPCLQRSTK